MNKRLIMVAGLLWGLSSNLGAQEVPFDALNATLIDQQQFAPDQIPALDDQFLQDIPLLPAGGGTMDITPASTSNKISLDIKGMDVVDVLKMLAQRAGLNVVVGKNVAGRVTLFLKDVDIWDAFEIILASNDLAYEKKGGIINVMTQRDYELLYGDRFQDKKQVKVIQLKYAKASDLARALVQIKSNVGRVVVDEASNTIAIIDGPDAVLKIEEFIKRADLPLETKIFNLNYAQADKLSAKLQESITKGLGTLKIDERTNKIIISDYPEKIAEIEKIILAFDEKTPQVLINAQVIQVTPSDKFEMGVDWNYWIKKYFEARMSLPINSANALIVGTATNSTVSAVGDYKGVIDVLRTIGDVKVLSSPRVMALNNQEAKIHVGTRDAYITSTTSQAGTGTAITSQSVNFVDTGIQLSVTPTISRDGFITMKIKPQISEADRENIVAENQTTQVPIVTTSEAETAVVVKDGVTIIIGGLRKDKRDKTVKKIPLLGDIPLLGHLFRSTSDEVTQTDLVILLTPHIMTGEDPFTDFSEIKPKEGAIYKMDKGKIKKDSFSDSAMVSGQQEAEWNSYSKGVVERVQEKAALVKPSAEKGEVKVSFVLGSDGKLINEPAVFSTTNAALSPSAIKAVKEAAPFPVFGPLSKKKEETFKITLRYK